MALFVNQRSPNQKITYNTEHNLAIINIYDESISIEIAPLLSKKTETITNEYETPKDFRMQVCLGGSSGIISVCKVEGVRKIWHKIHAPSTESNKIINTVLSNLRPLEKANCLLFLENGS